MIPAIQGVEDQHTIVSLCTCVDLYLESRQLTHFLQDEPEDEQACLPASAAPVNQAHEPQSRILTTKLVKSQQPRPGPDAHGEPPNLSVDNSAPTSHSTSTLDTTRTLQTKDEGKARAGTGKHARL